MIRRLQYYLSSIPILLGQISDWQVLFYVLLTRKPTVLKLRTGCQFHIRDLTDAWIIKEACLDRDYERGFGSIEACQVIVDIGAGIGEFAVCAARRYPHCQVYAFEPFLDSYRLLIENVELNGLGNQVRCFNQAITSNTGTTTLSVAALAPQHTTVGAAQSLDTLQVESRSLEDVFRSNEIEGCDLLKIDCEGCEFEVLLNAPADVLRKIKRISLEYHEGVTPYTHEALVSHLRANGFSVTTQPNPAHKYLGFLFAERYD